MDRRVRLSEEGFSGVVTEKGPSEPVTPFSMAPVPSVFSSKIPGATAKTSDPPCAVMVPSAAVTETATPLLPNGALSGSQALIWLGDT